MPENPMLDRLVTTLKRDIAPAIDDEFLKTQAYMSSVVVEKLARQLALESEHAAAASSDLDALIADLRVLLSQADPAPALQQAFEAVESGRDPGSLCALIEALYAARESVGEANFTALLGRIRQTLRADIDRRMVYAK